MNAEELCCREVVELLDGHLEGATAPAQRACVDGHLVGCAGCTAYLGQLATTVRLVGRLAAPQVPPIAMASLLDAFRAWPHP